MEYAMPHRRRSHGLSIPERLETIRTMGWSIGSSRRNRDETVRGRVGFPWNARNLEAATAWNPTRMRNIILAVGPTTPAAVCWESLSASEDEEDGFDDEVDDDSDLDDYVRQDDESEHDREGDGSEGASVESDVDSKGGNSGIKQGNTPQHAVSAQLNFESTETTRSPVSDDQLEVPEDRPLRRKSRWSPSIRHGGCINTACWLNTVDSPWRLSTASNSTSLGSPHGVDSREASTQLMTSSDDRLIKVWDVSHAMGTASPLPGGWDTFAPFALGLDHTKIGTPEQYASWRRYYRQYGHDDYNMAGSVCLLASVSSGHQGNVFHMTSIGSAPGKVLTCGADGSLRMTDLNAEISAVVVHPYAIDTDGAWEHLGSGVGGMAYSHLSLTAQTGLLCSERGLHHFDLRVSPSAQNRRSLMPSRTPENGNVDDNTAEGQRSDPCKACVVWSPHCQHSSLQETEPNLVFVGGGSAFVELLDLRMDGFNRKVLQRYKPRCLTNDGDISVSGLDVSKDGRELLVSYESDQIFSFPIFPGVSTGPTLDDVDAAAAKFPDDPDAYLPEMISYGGHLNRFTFLKNARYAGPNDNFIVTGSDSGKAWIYERKTGAVVSLLGADSSTCNGVIPHPSWPFFITYGIDSTAKLWRAAPCVDPSFDDSRSGRAKASLLVPYDISPVALQSDVAQGNLNPLVGMSGAMPDSVGPPHETASIGRFAAQTNPEICGETSARFGNALRLLPPSTRQARFECYRGKLDRLPGGPVHQPLEMVTVRASLNRLLHQAARLGLDVNPAAPWAFEGPKEVLLHLHKSDLVPDTPGDWLLYDERMTSTPLDFSILFNVSDYRGVLDRTFPNSTFFEADESRNALPWLTRQEQSVGTEDRSWRSILHDELSNYGSVSRKVLHETVTLLKDGGNAAVRQRLFHAGARRYDKAIQYCAVAFMRHYEGSHGMKHLSERVDPSAAGIALQGRPVSLILCWSPLLRLMISSRLNLSLTLIHPEVKQIYRAADQARFALKLLSPFTAKRGKIILACVHGDLTNELIVKHDEPHGTFEEAKAMEAKAYFRLGSAEMESSNYAGAAKSFQSSLQSLSRSNHRGKADPLVVRRLEEAKRKHESRKRRTTKKFRKLLSDDVGDTGS